MNEEKGVYSLEEWKALIAQERAKEKAITDKKNPTAAPSPEAEVAPIDKEELSDRHVTF